MDGDLTCQQLITHLDDYVAGALRARTRRQFDVHLAGCAECGAYLLTYRATMDLVRAAYQFDEHLPEDLIRRIQSDVAG